MGRPCAGQTQTRPEQYPQRLQSCPGSDRVQPQQGQAQPVALGLAPGTLAVRRVATGKHERARRQPGLTQGKAGHQVDQKSEDGDRRRSRPGQPEGCQPAQVGVAGAILEDCPRSAWTSRFRPPRLARAQRSRSWASVVVSSCQRASSLGQQSSQEGSGTQ